MKKARKFRFLGQDWKYFINGHVLDHDGEPFSRVTLYEPSGVKHFWNFTGRKRMITGASVKEAFLAGRFTRCAGLRDF